MKEVSKRCENLSEQDDAAAKEYDFESNESNESNATKDMPKSRACVGMRSRSDNVGTGGFAQQGLQVQCKMDESAFFDVFDSSDCKGQPKEGRSMDKESFDGFRKGKCGNFERGPGGGSGQSGMGKPRKGSMEMSGDIDDSTGAEEFGSCQKSYKVKMASYGDRSCRSSQDAQDSKMENRSFGKDRLGIMKQDGADGDFRRNKCQKIQSEDPSNATARPRKRGMRIVCDSNKTTKLQVFDDESCRGKPAEERKMSKESARKFKEGDCADFKKPDQDNEVGFMKRDLADGEAMQVDDCETEANQPADATGTNSTNQADHAIHASFLNAISFAFPVAILAAIL